MSTGSFEATEPFQHPIGYAVRQDSNDASIINSNADWIAPAARVSSASSCGSGHPRCKVTVNDSDHSYFGMWNESPRVNRNFFWINFTQGSQTLFMDPYTLDYPRQKRNLPRPPVVDGMGSGPDPRWENVRNTLGRAHRANICAALQRRCCSLSEVEAARRQIAAVHRGFGSGELTPSPQPFTNHPFDLPSAVLPLFSLFRCAGHLRCHGN
jgi:hypothetical protein